MRTPLPTAVAALGLLFAASPALRADPADRGAELRELKREHERLVRAAREAEPERDRLELEEQAALELAPRVLALADVEPEDRVSRDGLLWLVSVLPNEAPPGAEAVARLVDGFAADPALSRLSWAVGRFSPPLEEERALALLTRLAEAQPDVEDRATAHFYAARLLIESRPGEPAPERARAELAACLEQTKDERRAQLARDTLYTITTLDVGAPMVALEGVDLDGEPLALAELRGRVVLLSFWADW